jgi:hypothetical protein
MVLDAINAVEGPATVLDIGCGRGFDDDPKLQASLIAASGKYIGVEPDSDIEVHDDIEVHRSFLEDAQIEPGTVDVAFAVMVLEHIPEPARFFAAVRRALKPGGVFLGFTPNRRHYFVFWSSLLERIGLKDLYLRLLRGNGDDAYQNYPTHYRCNTAADVTSSAVGFATETADFNVRRMATGYLPGALRPLGNALDRVWVAAGLPGGILICRARKT